MKKAIDTAGHRSIRRHTVRMLLTDHEEIDRVLGQYERAWEARTKISLAEAVLEELTIHVAITEEAFYPAVRGRTIGKGPMDQAEEEIRAIKYLIGDLEAMDKYDERYEACFLMLAARVRRHIRMEEACILSKAETLALDWKKLDRRTAYLKKKLLGQLKNTPSEAVLEAGSGVC